MPMSQATHPLTSPPLLAHPSHPMWLLLTLACTPTGDDSAGTTAPCTGPGALDFTVAMTTDLTVSMDEPPVGTFRGSVFAEADATAIGPNDGAASLLDFTLDGVDLTATGIDSDVTKSDAIDPQIVWVLGCLDSDGNDCDENDAVTIPNENKVEVACGDPTPFEIFLGILQP